MTALIRVSCDTHYRPRSCWIWLLALYQNGFFTGVMIGARRLLRLSRARFGCASHEGPARVARPGSATPCPPTHPLSTTSCPTSCPTTAPYNGQVTPTSYRCGDRTKEPPPVRDDCRAPERATPLSAHPLCHPLCHYLSREIPQSLSLSPTHGPEHAPAASLSGLAKYLYL